jgi:hypothetical protein
MEVDMVLVEVPSRLLTTGRFSGPDRPQDGAGLLVPGCPRHDIYSARMLSGR